MPVYIVIFIEGLCSLGAEIIALRRLVPHMGSSILVTAPTIGFFLFALAVGYASGAQVQADFARRVGRNFLLAALIAGIGLAGGTVNALFDMARPAILAYLIYMLVVLCPIAWLLGQTVPILTNLMRHQRVGEASGMALYWSTLGSFLGATGLSLLVMQWLGVSAAVLLVAAGLVAGSLMLNHRSTLGWVGNLVVLALAVWINQPQPQVLADTAYAEYRVDNIPGSSNARRFRVNLSYSSQIDDSEPPRFSQYIERIRALLLNELALSNKQILVLGAGGFSLSHQEPSNHYTYVDIDPSIQAIAQTHFLKGPINGRFVAADARHFVDTTDQRFDAIVVDVYSSRNSIPSHLATREFWAGLRRPMNPGAALVANLILDGRLNSAYARNLLATIESVYGRCSVDVLKRGQPRSNVVVTCFEGGQPIPAVIYLDEHNRADIDRAINP